MQPGNIRTIVIELEGGIAVTGYSDVRIPGDAGTFIGVLGVRIYLLGAIPGRRSSMM